MREPRAFPSAFGVLNLGMTIVIALCITVGFYGYIEFGDDSKGSVTLNMDGWYDCVNASLYNLVNAEFSQCLFVLENVIYR